MARRPRVDFPGAVHHVYARGIEKRNIFHDDKDRLVFLERVGSNLGRWEARCFSWALMENHFHILIQTNKGFLPSFMRCLLTAYSMNFNDRHERVGHLFQNRYMSKVISKESYLREAIRYIHLNPIRAGIIKSLEELDGYPWTGHRQIMEANSTGWMDVAAIKEYFAAPGGQWKSFYRDFIRSGYAVSVRNSQGIEDKDAIFSKEVGSLEGKSLDGGKPPEIFFDIVESVSVQTGVPKELIMSKSRMHSHVNARKAVLLACMERLNVSAAKISKWLGISDACAHYLLRTKMKKWKKSLGTSPFLG